MYNSCAYNAHFMHIYAHLMCIHSRCVYVSVDQINNRGRRRKIVPAEVVQDFWPIEKLLNRVFNVEVVL